MPVIGTFPRARVSALLAMALFAMLAIFSPPAHAGCTTQSGTVSLGSVNAFTVESTPQNASGSTGFACTGSLLSIISTNQIHATIASVTNSNGTQARLYNAASGDYIPYVICKDAGCSATYAVGSQIDWSSTTFLGILSLFNASDGTLPIYIRTAPGARVAAGTYSSAISLNWSWHLCALGALGLCVYDDGTTTSIVNVTMIVTNDCAITAPTLNFGSAAFVGSFDPVTQSIAIRCTKDAAYSVGIDNGTHFSATRRLGYNGNYIPYEIYYPASSTTRWGNIGAERRSSALATTNAGVYTGAVDQIYTYKAAILPGGSSLPAGTYTDTLIIDVQF
ncbi:spore coat U domain-containing protein [Sphingobium aquiterrae]|uniref:Csu type fimbrial protein n=1 Tax=Sphingobium aquiterrae TaxID=2038656 RepID=UPI00301A2C65